MIKQVYCSGDKISLLNDPEFQDDTFIITKIRSLKDSYILDAICDGEESLCISVNSNEVKKINE